MPGPQDRRQQLGWEGKPPGWESGPGLDAPPSGLPQLPVDPALRRSPCGHQPSLQAGSLPLGSGDWVWPWGPSGVGAE